jgi:hypothetical protein
MMGNVLRPGIIRFVRIQNLLDESGREWPVYPSLYIKKWINQLIFSPCRRLPSATCNLQKPHSNRPWRLSRAETRIFGKHHTLALL